MIYEIKQLANCVHPTFELTQITYDGRGAKVQVPNGHKKYIIVEMVDMDLIALLQKELLIDFLMSHQLISDDELVQLKQNIRNYSYEVW